MASSSRTCRRFPAVKTLGQGRWLALGKMQADDRRVVPLAARAFVSYDHALQPRAKAPPSAAVGCAAAWKQALSTSAVGDGEDVGSQKGNNNRREDGGGGKAADDGAVAAERRDGSASGETAAVPEGVPLDARGMPRPKQRVDVELGTFHEFTAVNKTGGKIFEASRELIPEKDAEFFPAMEVSNLASDGSAAAASEVDFLSRVLAGRVTMVGLFHRQFGYSMLESWTGPFEETFARGQRGNKLPSAGGKTTGAAPPSALSLSLLESWPLRMMKPLLVSTMGRGLSPEKKAAFFYRFGPTEEVRKALGIVNRLTLYVLLVDQKGRVRWQGTGKATPDEVESLVRCARQLAAEGSGGGGGGDRGGARGGEQGKSKKKRGTSSLNGTARSQERHRGGRP
ncbi:ATP synthase: assembly factor for F1 component [Ectocarpus siliculosus]|uniref:ATP synthase: assembly factor for F1 component n=1 Tax=Ectocarpus siliculosus TaxID=2880 RepID=D7G2P9_ECTSI|nr:ATP synthase: assembly factor for F1 component [Ectocarpus siliculosus]|eukprot:CBJ26874.1 ATP synthase: assembly factor for F1 component [Ectocarpus siliculosus]